jgi:hypothetical protein
MDNMEETESISNGLASDVLHIARRSIFIA